MHSDFNYSEFVRSLFKQDTLPMMHLHAAIGLVGEIIEETFAITAENRKEELGDQAFYLQALLNFQQLDLAAFADCEKELDWFYLNEAGELLDEAKKFVIYLKPLDQSRWNRHAQNAAICFFSHLRSHGLTFAEVIEQNVAKLRRRYPSEAYSDADAQARKDKVKG